MRVTRKGQVTIPKPFRDRAGIMPGTEVEFAFRGGELVVRPRGDEKSAADKRVREFRGFLESIRGTADGGLTGEEITEMSRGPYNDLDGR